MARDSKPAGAQFVTGDGDIADGWDAVVPLCAERDDRSWRLVGTAFFICNNGIFATAKHVVLRRPDEPEPRLFVPYFLPGDRIINRPVRTLSCTNTGDVAIGTLAPLLHWGNVVTNRVMRLTTRRPRVGEIAAVFAYPTTREWLDNGGEFAIDLRTNWQFGHVEEYLPDGRDRTFLPHACYRTSVVIESGASGGPVADTHGRVFGICSTGYDLDADAEPVSFVSPVQQLGPCSIDGVRLPDGSELDRITVTELVDRGLIAVDAGDEAEE